MDDTAVDQPAGTPIRRRYARAAHRLLDRYHAVAQIVDRGAMGLAGLLVVTAVLATASAVLSRQFPAFPSVPWSSEATTLCVVTAVLLVVPQGLRHNTHLAVTMLTERLGPRWFRAVTVLNQLLCAVFFALLLWFGVEMADIQRQAHTPMLGVSLLWPYAAVALSGALMLVETLVRLTESLLGRFPDRDTRDGDDAAATSTGTASAARPTTPHGEV